MVDDLDHVPTKLEGSGPHSGEGALVGRMMALARETRLGETAVGPPVHLPAASVVPAAPPGFVLERELGRGGNGVVYLATQVGLNRPVALKTLKSASHPTAVIRFLAEAEAVAAVRHPNVVEVYQYGEDGGRPYLALEYCPGGDLAALADVRTWSPPEAATLMTGVADGVAAAHARGIVHRDLKPHNVLLVPAPGEPSTSVAWVPKVSDFGLAKRGGESNLTSTDSVMGTPAYMSPEQAGGGTKFVGPESDVWSLGVMLYELLAGTRPFPGPTSMDFLTQIVAGRFPPIRSVRPEVPRDLELIVGKCLRRDPRERYHSAAELAADLRNWQAGRPVSARPIGGVTAAIKWARRNKPLAASLALTVVALVAGTAVSAWQAVRATAAADRATQEARRADAEAAEARRQQVIATEKTAEALAHGRRADEERVRATATKDLLAGMVASTDALGLSGSALVPPGQGRGNLTIAELLGRGAELLRDPKYQADNRLVQLEKAAFADALGQALQSIGRAEQARPILEEAVAIHRRLLPADHPERMASELHLANLRAERGDFAEAEATYTALLDQHRADGTLDTLPAAEIQLRFCFLLLALKDERGPDLARAGLATQRRLLGERHRDTGVAWVLLAGNLFAQSDQKGGLDAAGQAVAALAGKDGFDRDKDPLIGAVLDYQTAIGYKTMGFSERAVTAFRKAADTTERVLGRDHMYRAAILGELGFNLRTAGHREAAAETWREFLEIMRRTAGVEHPTALTVIDAYADHLLAAGDPNGAWALLEETLRASTGRYGKAVRWRFPLVCSVALVAAKTGRTAAALELTEEALALFRQPAVAAKRDHLIRLSNLAEALGDLPDLTACRKAYEVIHADPRFASDPEVRWFNRRNFGVVLAKKKNYAEAEPHLREAASQAGTPFVRARSQPWQRSAAQFFFGKACWAAGKFDEAAAAFEAASEEERARGTAAEPDMELSRLMVLSATRRQPEVLRRAAERYEALPKIDLTDCAWSLFLQASASTPGSRRAVLDRLERVAGGSTNADVARYRAWAAVVGGGDLTREAERLDKLKARGEGIELARAAVALRRGRPDDALMVLRRLDGHDAASPPVARLRALLRTLAEYRAAPGDPARDAVRAELGAAGKLLDEAATWTNPDLSGSAAATLVALGWWRDRLRDEFAEARR